MGLQILLSDLPCSTEKARSIVGRGVSPSQDQSELPCSLVRIFPGVVMGLKLCVCACERLFFRVEHKN